MMTAALSLLVLGGLTLLRKKEDKRGNRAMMTTRVFLLSLLAAIGLLASKAAGSPHAVNVAAYGNTYAGSPFDDPTNGLGSPDGNPGLPMPYGTVSLGSYGSIVLELGQPVLDVAGPDLAVWEELTYQWDGVPGSAGNLPDESADVFLSLAPSSWTWVGRVERGDRSSLFIDITGTGMDGATYLRIEDVTGGTTASGANGFDLDAVTVLPEPASLSLLAAAALAAVRRRRS